MAQSPLTPSFCSSSKKGVCLHVRAMPRSGKNAVTEITDEYVKIAIKAPPVDNEANKELITFLSKLLGVSKSQIEIRAGGSGRNKLVEVSGMTVEGVKARINLEK